MRKVCIGLALALAFAMWGATASAVNIYFAAPDDTTAPVTATVGQIVPVAVFVQDVVGMSGYAVKIDVSGPGAAVSHAVDGTWLKTGHAVWADHANDPSDLSWAILLSPLSISGSGDLTIFYVQVTGVGDIDVAFNASPFDTFLSDINGDPVPDLGLGQPYRITGEGATNLVLSVQSLPMQGVDIAGDKPGTTNYQASCTAGDDVSLTAPDPIADGDIDYSLVGWTLNGVPASPGATLALTNISEHTTVVAMYARQTRTLNVASNPELNASIIGVGDLADRSGTTPYTATCGDEEAVSLAAPAVIISGTDHEFSHWTVDSVDQPAGQRTIDLTMSTATSAVANYVVYNELVVQSAPISGVSITSEAAGDVDVSGTTNYDLKWLAPAAPRVVFTAPETAASGALDYVFVNWTKDGADQGAGVRTLDFSMNGDFTCVAGYAVVQRNLAVSANVAVTITATPEAAGGDTDYARTLADETAVTLNAPVSVTVDTTEYLFVKWSLDTVDQPEGQTALSLTMSDDHAAAATYAAAVTLNVASSLDAEASVSITGTKPGDTPYSATCYTGQTVTLTAPASVAVGASSYMFEKWVVGAAEYTTREVSVAVTEATTATATYTEAQNSTYAFSYTHPGSVTMGADVVVPVTFENNDPPGSLGYDAVRFSFSATGPGTTTFKATDTLGTEYTFTNSGVWGPPAGFPLPAVYSGTDDWTLNFSAAGEYTITFNCFEIGNEASPFATDSVVVTVDKATPIVSEWPTASAIVTGEALSQSTLTGGAATVDGSFAFVDPAAVPPEGTCVADAIFTPTDTANYNTVPGTVSVLVRGTLALTIDSVPQGIGITGDVPGTTPYTEDVVDGSAVDLMAPAYAIVGGTTQKFVNWNVDGGADLLDRALTVTMDAAHSAVATYEVAPVTVYVASAAGSVDPIAATEGNIVQIAAFVANVNQMAGFDVKLSITGPGTAIGLATLGNWYDAQTSSTFDMPLADELMSMILTPRDISGSGDIAVYSILVTGAGTITVGLDPDISYLGDTAAGYIDFVPGAPIVINATEEALPVLTVESFPAGVGIGGSNSKGGNANYSVTCDEDEQVTLTADPAVVVVGAHYNFVRWIVDGTPQADLQTDVIVTMDGNRIVKALYEIVTWTLTVQSTPPGIDIMGSRPGQTDYTATCDDAEVVNLTATSLALLGGQTYGFVRWTGYADGQTAISVTMTADTTVIAEYVAVSHDLTVTSTPILGVDITGDKPGTTEYGAACNVNVSVLLIAPDSFAVGDLDYAFVRWTGHTDGDQSIAVLMDADKTAAAEYALAKRTLTVASDPSGVAIDGAGEYDDQTVVTLDAPDTAEIGGKDYRFSGWTVDGNAVAGDPINVTMDADHAAVASYTIQRWTLTVASDPSGVSIDGAGEYDDQTVVELAAPAPTTTIGGKTYNFTGWTVDGAPVSGNPINVTMDADHSAVANYQVAEYTLAVNSEPIKAVAIASDQAPGNTDYTTSVSAGSTVELTAPSQVTDGGKRYNFTGWTGDYTGANPATVVMDAQKSVTANYAVQTWTLTANSAPPGIVDEVQVVEDNTTVTLTAPDQGVVGGQRFNFVNWSTGADTLSIDVTVTTDTTVTANYEVQTWTLTANSAPAGIVDEVQVVEDNTTVTLTAPDQGVVGG
ncbi:MAG TPA: hypothetical protein VM223_05115, partial [Planctomycetota bacterium]|nr:hypothetical protein [Planctomycetota bacterium]